MHQLFTPVYRHLCIWLALCLWLVAAAPARGAQVVSEDDFLELFPSAEKVGESRNYVLTLDRVKVFVMLSSSPPYKVVLVILQSNGSKKIVQATTKRLAALLSSESTIIPYIGKGNGAGIVLPLDSSVQSLPGSPAYVLFPSSTSETRSLLKGIGWKDSVLLARIATFGNNKGEVEVAMDATSSRVRVLQMRKSRGKVDFYDFLSYPRRMELPSTGTSSSSLESGRSYLRTKNVLCYDSGEFCIAGNNKKMFFAGSPSYVRSALTEGIEVEPFEYPAESHPWPNEKKDDAKEETPQQQQQQQETPAKDNSPAPQQAEQQQPAQPEQKPKQPEAPAREPLPALPNELLDISPADALLEYLQMMHQI